MLAVFKGVVFDPFKPFDFEGAGNCCYPVGKLMF